MKHLPFIFTVCCLLAVLNLLAISSFQLPNESQSYGSVFRALTAPAVEVGTSTVLFVGDVLLARDVEIHMDQYGHDYPYRYTQEWLQSADIVVGNFEASIPQKHIATPHLHTQFSVATSSIPALAAAGFTHMSLANNHSLDFGQAGYLNSATTLEQSGIETFGAPNRYDGTSISYLETDLGVIALIGLNYIHTTHTANQIDNIMTESNFFSDIQIAYIHWGEEYVLEHNAAQQKIAHELIDAGIDLIIGHHPHVIQDIETYNNKLIVYSLGNFIFDQYFSRDVEIGLAVRLELTATPTLTLHPVSSESHRVTPALVDGREADEILLGLANRSTANLENKIINGAIPLALDLAVSP